MAKIVSINISSVNNFATLADAAERWDVKRYEVWNSSLQLNYLSGFFVLFGKMNFDSLAKNTNSWNWEKSHTRYVKLILCFFYDSWVIHLTLRNALSTSK
jgi:hypothetical protein